MSTEEFKVSGEYGITGEAVSAQAPLQSSVGAEAIPAAWFRGVRTPSTVHEPSEWNVDFSYGDDRPDGLGWMPLYSEKTVGTLLNSLADARQVITDTPVVVIDVAVARACGEDHLVEYTKMLLAWNDRAQPFKLTAQPTIEEAERSGADEAALQAQQGPDTSKSAVAKAIREGIIE